jgi:putative transport protein
MNFIVTTLRERPEIAIFLALAIGFWFGKFKFGSFSLGVVTSTLLAGVLIGQLNITISPHVKSTFFLMFLFAVGYSVGPQFFRGLKGDGLQQVFFALIVVATCLVSAVAMGKILGYDAGLTAGLYSGSSTISAALGVATDTINQLDLGAEEKKRMQDMMPVAYAVTYLFGTAGSAWFLASVGPKILGINLEQSCKEYEAKMGGNEGGDGAGRSAYTAVVARAYRLTNPQFIGKKVRDLELEVSFGNVRTFVERIRQGERIVEAEPDTRLEKSAVLALAGRPEAVAQYEATIGPEVDDRDLLNFEVSTLDIVVTNKSYHGKTIKEIAEMEMGRPGRGVFLRKMVRSGQEMPFKPGMVVERGDTLSVVGATKDVERAAKLIGYADRVTEKTDMMLMGFGIVLGALVGAITIRFGGIPISLSTSGGALIAGLVCGWLRSVNPTFGRIPGPALWVFNNIGLNTFIAVVGIGAGPSFIAGLKANGLGLFLAGIVVTLVPFIVGLFAGKWFFKMHPAILLGACAGARTTTAALGQIQEVAKSKVPALGYTITYAVGNTLLTIWGVVIVLLMT